MNHATRDHQALLLAATIILAACSGTERGANSDTGAAPPPPPATTDATPVAGGRTITVEMITDESGNYFKPKEVEAHRGDVIRFVLTSGVHNVNFLPDSNRVKTGLPVASAMLQLPGQTFDLKVDLPHGKYYFQCDPHAALGMVGYLEIEDEDEDR